MSKWHLNALFSFYGENWTWTNAILLLLKWKRNFITQGDFLKHLFDVQMLPPLFFFYSSCFPLSPPFQCVIQQFTFSKPPQLWFWTFSEVEWKLNLLWILGPCTFPVEVRVGTVFWHEWISQTITSSGTRVVLAVQCHPSSSFPKEEIIGVFLLFAIHNDFWHFVCA